MVIKRSGFPDVGELVVGTISNVNPYSAFVKLNEYPGKEGMIHISEVARKWISDIREFAKVGQNVVALVMRVDEEKGHIALSLKRVNKKAADERMKEYKREQKAEKMLALVGKEMGLTLEQVYEQIGFKLQETFDEIFKAFQVALDNEELLRKKGIEEKWIAALKAVAEKALEAKEVEIKGIAELKCFSSNGADVIKKILCEAEKKFGLEIKYISAPRYSLSLKTKNAKAGEKRLEEAGEFLASVIKAEGGEASFTLR